MTPSDYFDTYATTYAPYKNGAWCYEDGCLYRGLWWLYRRTNETRWLEHLLRLAGAQVMPDGQLAGYCKDDFNIDNILSGRCLFALAKITGEARFHKAADRLFDQLTHHPRTQGGNYWHKLRYPEQVWLDGLYMGLPFQIAYGQVMGRPDLVDDALAQFTQALDLTQGPNGLFLHGYDAARAQDWADPETGCNRAVWARAMGWLVMAMVDIAELLPDRAPIAKIRSTLRAVTDQQGASGLWPQVLDQPDLVGNYDETSASAMFAYGLARADDLGLAPDGMWREAANRALDAILTERLLPSAQDRRLQLTGICHVAGLGGFDGKTRDGTAAYYLSEDIVSDDVKGVGPLMMAWAVLRGH